jgi:mitochondrial fission protein ELM1
MSPSLQFIRVISEGRPGHQNQSLGLAQALARRTGATVEVIPIPTTFNFVPRWRAAAASTATQPQLLIGAGHKVHLPILLAARKFRARSVVIMAPTWPTWFFDCCILPQHDLGSAHHSARIIPTLGALNRLPEDIPAKQPRGVVLVGGPSKSHGWAAQITAEAIAAVLAARPELQWTVSDSRRTPAGFLEQLRVRGLRAEFHPHQQTASDWVPAQLMTATETWVTEDSVSMIFEAVTARARTGILPVPVIRPNADSVGAIRALVQQGYAMDYAAWRGGSGQLPIPKPLHETGRCADLVLQRLFPAVPSAVQK